MKTFRSTVLLGLAAALGLASTAAHAAITIGSSSAGPDVGPPAGFVTVLNYDGASGYFTESGGNVATAPTGGWPAATPLGTPDGTNFGYVFGSGTYTLTAPLIKGFSLYVGSIDTSNSITFFYQGNELAQFTGASFGGPADGSQDNPLNNRRINFDFGGASVDQVVFYDNYHQAFEFDNIAVPSAVPEPATWAMMIAGFGLMGAMLRRRRQALATA